MIIKLTEILAARRGELAVADAEMSSLRRVMTEQFEEQSLLNQALCGVGIRLDDSFPALGNGDLLWRFDWIHELLGRRLRATDQLEQAKTRFTDLEAEAAGYKAEIVGLEAEIRRLREER